MPEPVDITTKRGQVASIRCPGHRSPMPHAGPAGLRKASVEEDLRRGVVELIGMDGLHDGQLIARLPPGAAASPRAPHRTRHGVGNVTAGRAGGVGPDERVALDCR